MTVIAAVTNGNYTHYLDVTLVSQSISANTSVVSWNYYIVRNVSAGSGAFAGSPGREFDVTIDGSGHGNTLTFDFRSAGTISMNSGSQTVYHASDGTHTVTGSFQGPDTYVSAGFPITGGSGSLVLPTIPRASHATFDISGTAITTAHAGVTINIDTNRADATFTHTLAYAIGASSGTIATAVGASQSWTIPLSLLNEIPNTTSGTVVITTTTYDSSSNLIGTSTTNLTMTAGSGIVPTIGSVTATEATTSPNVASLIGGFVRGISTLAVAIVSGAGVYGSTIVSSSIAVGALQVISSSSGTSTPIADTGTVPVIGTVVDSRGRTVSVTHNVTVLAYAFPTVTTATAKRALTGGTLDPNGTYMSVNIVAAVQSLVVGSQKNDLTYSVKKQTRGGTTPWSSITPDSGPTDAHSTGLSTTFVIGTYSVANSYDVRIEVTDVLGNVTAVQSTFPTGGVLMHFSTTFDGFGVGKYWTIAGASIDANGPIYQNNGNLVVDVTTLATTAAAGIAKLAASSDVAAGTSSSLVVTPASLAGILPPGVVLAIAMAASPTGWLLCDGSAISRTTYANLFAALNPSIGTVTMTIAAPAVVTHTSHGLQTGQMVYLTTTGALPTGLTVNTVYYVVKIDANTFNLATSLANALAGTNITTTGSRSGTHTLRTTWGVGDGSTTFNVPTVKGSTLVGVDPGQVEFAALGQTGGEKTHTLTTTEMPSHQHPLPGGIVTPAPLSGDIAATTAGGSTYGFRYTGAPATVAMSNTGGGSAHNNLQPYTTMNYIIKT